MNKPTKPCAVCGREIQWRKKWERDWDSVRYCGEACRRNRTSADDGLEEAILARLRERARGLTICPSEVLPADERQDPQRMEEVRRAARRLVNVGRIEILQRGKVVAPSDFRGPIRLRLR